MEKQVVTINGTQYKMYKNPMTEWVFVQGKKGRSYPVAKISHGIIMENAMTLIHPNTNTTELAKAWVKNLPDEVDYE